jgi:hypothetical protein
VSGAPRERRKQRQGVARGDPQVLDGTGWAGCMGVSPIVTRPRLAASDRVRGEAEHVNNARRGARSDRKVRVEPMEGALVRSVVVVLNRRRQRRAWRVGVLGDAG